MARRGRPAGVDSDVTRTTIINAARVVFAERGFAASTVAALAEAAGLAPSAIYHYFGGKAELYEAVFDATADGIWADLDSSVHAHDTVESALRAMLDNALATHDSLPSYSDFLALVPMEARLHPGFAHLLDRRAKHQDATFNALAALGHATGELAAFTLGEATEFLRASVMGWFFESHFRGAPAPGSRDAVIKLFRAAAASAEQADQ